MTDWGNPTRILAILQRYVSAHSTRLWVKDDDGAVPRCLASFPKEDLSLLIDRGSPLGTRSGVNGGTGFRGASSSNQGCRFTIQTSTSQWVEFESLMPFTPEQRERMRLSAGVLRSVFVGIKDVHRRRVRFRGTTDRSEAIRQEVANVLHGTLQTKLLLIESRLANIRFRYQDIMGSTTEELRGLEEDIKRLCDEDVRQLSHRLHPDLIDVGLIPALRVLLNTFHPMLASTLSVAPAVFAVDCADNNQIPAPVRITVYRIIEEALNNATRHGQASHATVSIQYSAEDGMVVLIQDNGIGYHPNSSGIGIRNARLAARRLGGSFEVGGGPKDGTIVRMSVPLRGRSRAALNTS